MDEKLKSRFCDNYCVYNMLSKTYVMPVDYRKIWYVMSQEDLKEQYCEHCPLNEVKDCQTK